MTEEAPLRCQKKTEQSLAAVPRVKINFHAEENIICTFFEPKFPRYKLGQFEPKISSVQILLGYVSGCTEQTVGTLVQILYKK
jgi:hypothetical protein